MKEQVRQRRRSELEAWDGCPWHYYQVYVQGVEDQGDESHRGVAFHEAAFQYIESLVAHQVEADADLANDALKRAIERTQLPTHLFDELASLWVRFTEWFQLDLAAYLTAEEKQETRRFTWRPDLVYVRPSGVEIWDWKTYYKGLTEAQAREEFQLKFYLHQAMEIWPNFPSYTFQFVFVRLGYSVRVTLKPEEIEAFGPQIDGLVDRMGNAESADEGGPENFPATPGSHCTLCRIACPVTDNPAKLPVRFVTKEQAIQAAGEILAAEQRLKALKKSLAGWCTTDGPLVVNGQIFQHKGSESVSYPAPGVIELLVAAGIDPNLLKVSATNVKAADKLKAVVGSPGLVKIGSSKSSWRFGHSKAGATGADEEDES